MKTRKHIVLALGLLVAATAVADNARAKTGAALTYLLNGSPVYKGTIINYDAGFTQNGQTITSFNLDDTAFIMMQCTERALVCNAHVADGGCTRTRALQLEAAERFILGSLQPKVPVVAVLAHDAGRTDCSVFELK